MAGGFIGINYEPSGGTTTENITTFNSPGTFTAQSNQTVADIFLLGGGGGVNPGGGDAGGGASPRTGSCRHRAWRQEQPPPRHRHRRRGRPLDGRTGAAAAPARGA